MTKDDAIALIISATKARNIARRTLKRAEEDIELAESILLREDGMAPDEVIEIGEHRLRRVTRKGRKAIDNEALIAKWEDLPASIRDRFDSTYQGTVAELEKVLGERHLDFVKYGSEREHVVVRDRSFADEHDHPERIVF